MTTLTTPDARVRAANYLPSVVIVNLFSSTTAANAIDRWVAARYADWTHGAALAAIPENPIAELRRISGLTWEQVAQMMGVDRRTLHFWEAGRPMRPKHQERLQRALRIVRRANQGDAGSTRKCLLDASQGAMLKDLLANEDFDEAMRRVESLSAPHTTRGPNPLSLEGRRSRQGPSVAQKAEIIETPVAIPILGPGQPARIARVGRK